MRINLMCPVEAWKVTLPTKECKEFEITLYNLSRRQVVSVEVVLLLHLKDDEDSIQIVHRGLGLNGAPESRFTMSVPLDRYIDMEEYELTINKVWFDDLVIWRHEKGSMTEYQPNHLRSSPELTELRNIAGEMASGYPVQQEKLWLCVCGRPNPNELLGCTRCHRAKAEVFTRFNKQAVRGAIEARESQLRQKSFETLRQNSQEGGKIRRERSFRWLKRLVLILLLLTVVTGAVWHIGGPYLRYEIAAYHQAHGNPEKAAQGFAALGDFKEAPARAARCRFEYADALLNEAADEASLMQARALFESLGDDEDAATRVGDCDWSMAERRFSQGDLEGAKKLYQAIESRPEAQERLQEIAYRQACAQLESDQWEAARTTFDELGNYKDSEAKYLDTWYDQATLALANGQEDLALVLLQEIPGHRDADRLISKIYYDRGAALRNAGKNTEAAEAFTLAGDYEDAADQAKACFYVPASVAFETMAYEQAAELFARIPDYKDAKEKGELATIEAARIAMKQINYPKAKALLETLPEDNAEAAALLLDCTYDPATYAYYRGDYAEAIALFEQIPGHRDAEEMILKCRYSWARTLRDEGKPAEAAALYAELGNYENAPSLLTACRYEQANLLAASESPEDVAQAVAIYTELGAYQDAPTRLTAARFTQAEALLAAGDAAAAREIFAALPASAQTKERIAACDMALAQFLESSGKTEEALAAYTALGDYGDAAKAAENLRYQQAATLAETDPAAALTALQSLSLPEAAEKISEIQYRLAEDKVETNPDEAIVAFEALGNYGDAPARAQALRYAKAAALEAEGDWEAACAQYDLLSGYLDSTTRADRLRYDAGMAYAKEGEWEKAQVALGAMSSDIDSEEQVNLLRYQAAEDLLADGQTEAAAVAFEAISGYRDAAKQAGKIRYQQAETLAAADWAAAAALFRKIAPYADSAERANALTYNQAAKLAAAGDWRAASELYASLGDYSNAADLALRVRYQAADKYVAAQQWEDAIALFTELGSYADSANRALQTRYSQAAAIGSTDPLAAAKLFQTLGNHSDAAKQADAMYEKYYAGPATAIAQAREAKNWAEVIQVMGWLDTANLPQKYQYLNDLYHEACFNQANQLFLEGKPYDALVYYKQLPDGYGNVSNRLQEACYLILGTWEDLQGNRYIFREEGVCSLNGERLYFIVEDTAMYTGEKQTMMAVTHRLTGVNRSHAWLYDLRGEKEVTIYLTRISD